LLGRIQAAGGLWAAVCSAVAWQSADRLQLFTERAWSVIFVLHASCNAVQGNMDPGVLFGSEETIEKRVVETIEKGKGQRHIMNLGHGVMVRLASVVHVGLCIG